MTPLPFIHGLAVSAVLVSGFARAQTSPPDPCAPTATSTVEMNLCAEQRFEAADHALNEAYQTLLSRLDGEHRGKTREKLIAAQRLGIRFRDAECAAEESVWGGEACTRPCSSTAGGPVRCTGSGSSTPPTGRAADDGLPRP
jgi:uncharacterized protein YecT (DUF1311 family)